MDRRAHVIVALVVTVGCGGGSGGGSGRCGPDLATDVMTASDADATVALVYDDFVATADNLCPDPAADVPSLSVRGSHASRGQFHICIPRPDLAETTGHVGAGEIEIFSADAEQDGCTFQLSTGASGFGGLDVGGFCNAGTNTAGFRMSTSIQVPMTRDCGAGADGLTLVFAGTVDVAAQ